MTPKEILHEVDVIAQKAVMLDADSPLEDFLPLRERLVAVHDVAKLAGLVILHDVASLGMHLLVPEKLSDLVIRPELMKQLERVITMLCTIADELHENGESRTSFKSDIADIRLFLNEADETAKPSTQASATRSEEEEFLSEMMQRLDAVESTLINLPRGVANPERMLSMFREYHTLKGEAGVLGFSDLNKWFHAVEDALDPARHRPIACTDDLVDAIMGVTDMSRLLMKGQECDGAARDAAVRYLGDTVKATPDATVTQSAPEEAPVADVDAFFAGMAEGADALEGSPGEELSLEEVDAILATGPAAVPLSASASASAIAPMSASALGLPRDPMLDMSSQTSIEDQSIVPIEEISRIPVSIEQIDLLLERIGEVSTLVSLVTGNTRLSEIADPSLQEDMHHLSIAANALQMGVMGLRMLPIQPLFQRMRRAAYDVARTSHKRVEMAFKGESTRVDRAVMEHLATALVHLLRNAIDHGLESPHERTARGKPEAGTITMNAYRSGSDIVIEVDDDGKGLNIDRIREHAIEKGLIAPDAVLSDTEAAGLIFRSGFSTAERITTVSGRGVGMDVVNTAVKALRGQIDVENRPGRGVTVRIRFPVSLSAVEALFVDVGTSRLAIPVHCVRESFRPQSAVIQHVKERGTVVQLRGLLLPMIHLGKMLGIPYRAEKPEDGLLVVVEQGGRSAVLLVDEVVATRQVLIRELEGDLARIACITGGIIMENRQVGLVVDIQKILQTVSTAARGDAGGERPGDRTETIEIGYNRVGMVDFAIRHNKGGRVENSRYAINAFKAREFVTMQALTPLPKTPKGFAGMLMLRNRTIPVVDLAAVLGMVPAASDSDTVIICEFSGQTIGLRVSSVNRVNYISWNDILPPPEGSEMLKIRQIVGSILMEGDIVFLLDFERIVQEVIRLYAGFGDLLEGVEQRKSGSTVLLVEDSAIIRKQTAAALEHAGLTVITKSNGQEALDYLLELAEEVLASGLTVFEKLDLVLSDIEMPLMDGYTLTLAIKNHAHLRVLPVLLHSSLTNETIIRRAREVHADGFVPKCAPAELAEHLRRYL